MQDNKLIPGVPHAAKGRGGGKVYMGGYLQGQSRPIYFLYEGLRQCWIFHCATYDYA